MPTDNWCSIFHASGREESPKGYIVLHSDQKGTRHSVISKLRLQRRLLCDLSWYRNSHTTLFKTALKSFYSICLLFLLFIVYFLCFSFFILLSPGTSTSITFTSFVCLQIQRLVFYLKGFQNSQRHALDSIHTSYQLSETLPLSTIAGGYTMPPLVFSLLCIFTQQMVCSPFSPHSLHILICLFGTFCNLFLVIPLVRRILETQCAPSSLLC